MNTPAPITKARLAIYKRNLEKYRKEGDEEKVAIQERLIARLERDGDQ